MGDYTKGIATINLHSKGLSLPGILRDLYLMMERSVDMLHCAMTSFAEEDLQKAKNIILEDDVIDECYVKLYDEAVNYELSDPRNIERANYVIWAAHHLERFGDRVTNICERVIYIITGEYAEISPAPG